MKISSSVIPAKFYSNSDTQKMDIIKENKNKSGIYRWVNKVNNNSYIGSAINLSRRLYSHYHGNKSNIILQQAILKHGLSNFSIEILEYCDKSVLIEREIFYINSIKPEYNINPIAGSSLGAKHSEETRKKISDALKGRFTGENNSQYGLKGEKSFHFGKLRSKETREKMSKAKGSTIYVYNLDIILLNTFFSAKGAAKYFFCGHVTIIKYARSNYIFKNEYILSLEPLKSNFTPILPKSYTIYIYSLDNQLLHTFNSSRVAAKHFDVDSKTILNYTKSGKIFQKKFILSLIELSSSSSDLPPS